MNIISDTFLQTYNNFSVYYINRKGYRRYQITCNEAVGCSKIRKLIDASRFQRQYPTEVSYSYAMTVHKSQGSTYKAVVINKNDLNFNRDKYENKRLWYTAITRAAKKVIIYTPPIYEGRV